MTKQENAICIVFQLILFVSIIETGLGCSSLVECIESSSSSSLSRERLALLQRKQHVASKIPGLIFLHNLRGGERSSSPFDRFTVLKGDEEDNEDDDDDDEDMGKFETSKLAEVSRIQQCQNQS